MLLKNLKVTNNQGKYLDLPLEDVSGGFVVQEITGLGPVKATLVSSSFANLDGEQYHSSRREARNIVITLGLDPDYAAYSAHDLRDQLYNFFMPKSAILLELNLFDKFSNSFLGQNLNLEINGRIESFEPQLFTKNPGVEISIMCFDPDLIIPTPVIFSGSTTDGLTETDLVYSGKIETGVVLTLLPNRAISEFTIYHRSPDNVLSTAYFAYPLVGADKLDISSIVGNKYVTLTRIGVESSILYSLSPQSKWIELFPGINGIRVHALGDPIPFSIEYTLKYGGV